MRAGSSAKRLDAATTGAIRRPERARTAPAAHQHICAALNALLAALPPPHERPLRLLDIGCGDGRLLGSLQEHLPAGVELHGFDVAEMGYQDRQLADRAAERLALSFPHVDWGERIRIVSDPADWGYPEGWFDFAVSNQVLEHVADLPAFLANLRRCLAPGGTSVHLFPLKNCLFEGHIRVFAAHRFRSHAMQRRWIYWMNAAGLGGYRKDARVLQYESLEKYAFDMADFLQASTSYRTFSQIAGACNGQGLSIEYAYTGGLYASKLRKLLGMAPKLAYARRRSTLVEFMLFNLLKYGPSSTLLMRRIDYDVGRRIRLEKDAAEGA
jgi:SAM-dependent methyltransferase